jgi:hypothetical protein
MTTPSIDNDDDEDHYDDDDDDDTDTDTGATGQARSNADVPPPIGYDDNDDVPNVNESDFKPLEIKTDDDIIRSLSSSSPICGPCHTILMPYLPRDLIDVILHYTVSLLMIGMEYERVLNFQAAYPWFENSLASCERDYERSFHTEDDNTSSKHESLTIDAEYGPSLFQTAFYLRVGLNAAKIDDIRGSRLLLRALEVNYVPAYAPMARNYFYGKGVGRDLRKARELMEQG